MIRVEMINNPKYFIFVFITKMGYYEDNKSKLLKKAHEKYRIGDDKEKAVLYYQKKQNMDQRKIKRQL